MVRQREAAPDGDPGGASAVNSGAAGRIAVTGFGLVTPMGFTSWRSVAAVIRSRSRFAWHETVLVADSPEGVDLRGATVSRVLDGEAGYGLSGSERSKALLAPALRETVAGLPSSGATAEAWIVNGIAEGEGGTAPCPKDILSRLSSVAYLPVTGETGSGRCLFLDCVAGAVKALEEGRCQRALVAAVDSLCFLPVLERLLATGRLQSGPNPEGIIPGEAAGALLLEREGSARKRNAPVYAFISSVGRGVDPASRAEGLSSLGQGLAEAFLQAFAALPAADGELGLVIADLNGERQRALAWALAEGRVFSASDRERQLWLPAFAVGECGAALGAVQAVVAVAALAKNKAHGRRVALCASADGGEARVLCFDQGDFADRHALNRWRRGLRAKRGT